MFNLVKNIKMSEQISPNQEIKKTHPIKSFFKKVLFFFCTLFFITVLGAIFYFNSTAEKGFSAGVLVNFSEKGLIFKTYEGTLNVGSMSTATGNSIANNTWTFSVKEEDVIAKMNEIMKGSNKNVNLHYVEKRGNFFWQGETNRFVDSVNLVP